jgi:hypothetical protein
MGLLEVAVPVLQAVSCCWTCWLLLLLLLLALPLLLLGA